MDVKSNIYDTKIKICQSVWDERTETLVKKLNPCIGIDLLKENVENGKIILYNVALDEKPIGIFFVRIDKTYDGNEELCIMFTVSDVETPVPFYSLLSFCYDKISNGRDIRIHSPNRVIDKFCESNGFEYLESVFIKRYKKNDK